MDTSSADSGKDGGENKSIDTEKLDSVAGKVDSSDETAGAESGNPETNKVLAYGPARRSVEAPDIKAHRAPESSEAPEIKADKAPDAAPKKEPVKGSALVPFVPRVQEKIEDEPRVRARAALFESLRSRGMQAALVAAAVGIAWAFAGSFFSGSSVRATQQQHVAALPNTVEPQHPGVAPAENAETRRLADEVRVLKKEIDSLRSAIAQNSPEEIHALKKSVDSLRNGLEGTKSEIGTSLAQLSAKLDRAQHDPAKLREISDRLDHMEHTAPLTTASIAPAPAEAPKPVAVPLPPAKSQSTVQPQTMAAKQSPVPSPAATPEQRPQLITNWVVRDVYDGIALVEGPHGSIEVIEGETIPGVGTVKSIEKRGSGWIVVTSRGLVDSARN